MYFWKEIKIGDGRVNVLLGKDPELGSFPHESPIVDFDGKYDPFFNEGMELIGNYIENKIDEKVGFFDYYNRESLKELYGIFSIILEYSFKED